MIEPQDKLTIETPELIPLEFPLAGIGSRFLALAVDTLIQLGISVVMAVAGILFFESSLAHFRRAGIWMAAVAVLAYFLLQFGYFAGFEAYWNGQTPGKRRLHLRVIKDSGRPINVYDSVARNLLRIVDSLPGIYGVGILSMLASPRSQRLGDFVAGTVVVHEQPLVSRAGLDWTRQSASARSGYDSGYDIGQLTRDEFQLMEAFLARRDELKSEVRNTMARKIVLRVGAKLKIPEPPNPEALVEKLAGEYRRRALLSGRR